MPPTSKRAAARPDPQPPVSEPVSTTLEAVVQEAVLSREPKRLSVEQMGILMSDLADSRVASRSQGGANLSYVEAHDIKATLIRVFGFLGFSADVLDAKIVQVREVETFPQHVQRGGQKAGEPKTPVVIAQSTVRLTIHGYGPDGGDVTYTETAVGSNSGYDIGDVADNAIKSASSDALKRCAIYLGTQFGLSLYNRGQRNEIVRAIFEPEQRETLEQVMGRVPDAEQIAADEAAAAEQFQRSLGATRVMEQSGMVDAAATGQVLPQVQQAAEQVVTGNYGPMSPPPGTYVPNPAYDGGSIGQMNEEQGS